ncbi:MAG: tRNA(Ile)-lysidine synthase [Myxococcota bacterium]
MIGFVQKVRHTILRQKLLSPGQRVAVGVSGGPDSVALTRALAALRYDLVLVYVDHQTRTETVVESAFVEALASSVGALFKRVAVEPISHSEEALRDARYGAFAQLDTDRIALGHTASDQAETVLMRMVRGAGITGLAGIPVRRGPFVRPLLDRTRTEVVSYLSEINQGFCTDESNASLDPVRNRVRHVLLPLLQNQFLPTVERSLCRLAETTRRDRGFIEDAARAFITDHTEPEGIAVTSLRAAHAALVPHIVRAACPEPLGFERLEAVVALIAKGRGEVQLEGSVVAAIRRSGHLWFRPKNT